MKKEIVRKLDIKEIIMKSVQMYKNNFRILFALSLVGLALSIASEMFMKLISLSNISSNPQRIWGVSIIVVIFMMIIIYYGLKVNLAMELAVRDLHDKKIATARESLKNTKGLIWKVFGTMLLIFLMALIPIIMIQYGMRIRTLFVIKAVVLTIGCALFILIGVKTIFAPVIRLLEPDNRNYFKYSNQLVKGNFFIVMILVALSNTTLIGNQILAQLIHVDTLGTFGKTIYTVVRLLYGLMLGPFEASILIITFLSLSVNRNKYTKNKKEKCI